MWVAQRREAAPRAMSEGMSESVRTSAAADKAPGGSSNSARMVMIVTRKFSAVAIDEAPANCTPIVKKTCPIGCVSESGT